MVKRSFCFNYVTFIVDSDRVKSGRAVARAECISELKCNYEGSDPNGNETYLSGIRELTPLEEENLHKMPLEDWRTL